MKIKKENPPNFIKISSRFDLSGAKPVFTYGDTIYNPHGAFLEPHILIHEKVHMKQQGEKPQEWWDRYLEDDDFRLEQELEAYATQYAFAKKEYSTKIAKLVLDHISADLAGEIYGNLLDQSKAETLIRYKAKELLQNS